MLVYEFYLIKLTGYQTIMGVQDFPTNVYTKTNNCYVTND